MKKKLLSLVMALGLVLVIGAPTYALSTAGTSALFADTTTTSGTTGSTTSGGTCGSTQTSLVTCDSSTTTGLSAINSLIKIALTVVSVLVGVAGVGGLAYAAIIYASARDNQNQVTEARAIIRNVVIGLVLYVFTIVIVNWLIPGGIIGGDATNTGTGTNTTTGTSTSTGTTPTQSASPTVVQ